MSLNGYVGSSADAQRIRRLEEKRQKEKADFEARPSRGQRRRNGCSLCQPYRSATRSAARARPSRGHLTR